jgi:hypothetical protein
MNIEMSWLKVSQDVVVPMHHETFDVKANEQVGSYQSTFNPDVENAIV